MKPGAINGRGKFFLPGATVAKLTEVMKKTFLLLLLCSTLTLSAVAQNWSVGAGTGPFVFGDFVRRTLQIGTETGSGQQTTILSAATRAGLTVDLERNLGERFALRLEGTFSRAPLSVKGRSSSGGVALDSARISVGTFVVPLVSRLNPRGTVRFHVMGGPAYAIYTIDRTDPTSTLSTFTGDRGRWGASLGGGVAWQWSHRFALEGQITDVSTTSPFRREDMPRGFGTIKIPRTNNVHTTGGIRYRF